MSRRHDSENEDDPEPFQSSGDEWDADDAKKEDGRRKSARITRKPKRPVVDESGSESEEEEPDVSEEEDSSEDEEVAQKKRKANKKGAGGGKGKASPKKQKVNNDNDLSNDSNSNMSKDQDKEGGSSDSDSSKNVPSRGIHRKFIPKTIFSEDYATGSFVILKKDAQGGDPSKHPVIWRIDGKALLQKYEAFDEEDKVRHKYTSIYTGWSPLDKDLYAPITVDVIRHNNNNLTVEVQWDKLKVINADSD